LIELKVYSHKAYQLFHLEKNSKTIDNYMYLLEPSRVFEGTLGTLGVKKINFLIIPFKIKLFLNYNQLKEI